MAAEEDRKRAAGLGTAFFVVLILCGLLLVIFGGAGGEATQEEGPDPKEQRLWEAYSSADQADRALTSNDFGEAQRHVRDIKDTLGTLVRQRESE